MIHLRWESQRWTEEEEEERQLLRTIISKNSKSPWAILECFWKMVWDVVEAGPGNHQRGFQHL